ncbi:MAG: hypothetical protein WC955_12935, partial [Elusimicrobiota bacterium]
MIVFPLIRKKGSNEHVMSDVFKVTLLYLIPGWIKSPQELLNFIVVLITALGIDVILNFIRYKQITCAVSAGVTAAIL